MEKLLDMITAALDRVADKGVPDEGAVESASFEFGAEGVKVKITAEGAEPFEATVAIDDIADALDEDVAEAPAAEQGKGG